MTLELLRRSALRLLPVAFIVIVPCLAVAQSAIDYCEPSPAVKADLREVDKLYDEDLGGKIRRDRQIALLQEVLKKHPTDFHVRRRYLDIRLGGFLVDRNALVVEYRDLMEKNPNDPIAVYLYSRLLYGHDTKETIALATKVIQDAPEFPWPHLQLAEIYYTPNFRDQAKLKQHLGLWFKQCPGTTAGFVMISRSGDQEMMRDAAQRLRARLESSAKTEDLTLWEQLWTLEFKVRTVPEHQQVRAQIAEDVKRIRAQNFNNEQWLRALQDGYKQLGDKAGQRWAEDELVRLLPKSAIARRTIQTRYYDEHPYPKGESSEAEKQAYHRGMVEVTSEWTRQWPDDESLWSSRTRSLMALEKTAPGEVEAAYKGYTKAHDLGGMFYTIPPLEVSVARFYLKQDFHVAKVPGMLLEALTEFEQIDKNFGLSDLYPRPGGNEGGNLKFVRSEIWPLLADAYARLKQPEKAQAVLTQLGDLAAPKNAAEPVSDSEKRSAAYYQGLYWRAVGKVAEVEHRKLDALTAYQTAMALRLNPVDEADKKDELNNDTQRLWKELGGTDQGWKAYLARKSAAKNKMSIAEISTWDSKNTTLPEFELADLEGRKWTLADLKGKVAFINFWATWCGPCREELPYVQKLRDQLKDRKEVVVLTLNTDDEVGKVEPFMKENKYTFPVLLGQAYADNQGVNSIPRNWVISVDGKVLFEGIGFNNDGEDWLKKAKDIIEKVKSPN